jgi:DinB superfamily
MAFELDSVVRSLARTPHVLQALLGGLPEPRARLDYGPATFSPYDVVGHLIHGEYTDWIPRARTILEHGEARPFEPFDRFAMRETDQAIPFDDLLARFDSLRADNLATLQHWQLEPEQLDRIGRHPELGRVTLRQLLASWVAHDLDHTRQLTEALAHYYVDDVGPWYPYLPILSAN